MQAHASRNLSLDESLVVSGDFSAESGRAAALELVESGAPFDALVAANDGMAAAAMGVLTARGLSIPGDVAVCGFDDVEESRFASPPISSVRQPWRSRARLAVDAILAQRAGRAAVSQRVAAEFVPRRSCGCGVSFDVAGAVRAADPRAAGRQLGLAQVDGRQPVERVLAARHPARGRARARARRVLLGRGAGATRRRLSLAARAGAVRTPGGALEPVGVALFLARLRAQVLDRLQGRPDARAKAETLAHAALERVSYAAERQQALRRLEFERQGRLLALAGQATRTAFDTQGIGVSLRQQLPELGVPSFFVSEYRPRACRRDELPARSRLRHHARALPARRNVPEAASSTRRSRAGGVWPEEPVGLRGRGAALPGRALGFALFEIGPRQGAIYMALREQLSAALKGAALVRQVAQRARQREQAERARMEEELRIARRIQVSILPTRWSIEGLDVAAALLPGQLPGADYFDIRPDADGAWLVVGSARGGGLRAGLIIPMLQSIVASLVPRAFTARSGRACCASRCRCCARISRCACRSASTSISWSRATRRRACSSSRPTTTA